MCLIEGKGTKITQAEHQCFIKKTVRFYGELVKLRKVSGTVWLTLLISQEALFQIL
jgi:hypothetical protein